jgi:hypothetical protein
MRDYNDNLNTDNICTVLYQKFVSFAEITVDIYSVVVPNTHWKLLYIFVRNYYKRIFLRNGGTVHAAAKKKLKTQSWWSVTIEKNLKSLIPLKAEQVLPNDEKFW